jgi:uncharacterized membrane protein
MESRTKLFGHPVHPMLIVFPLGLLGAAVVFDVIRLVNGNGYWSEIAFWLIAAGVVSGLIAAPFGAIDWLAIPSGTRAARIGFLHGAGNVIVLMLFALSWWMRRDTPGLPGTFALTASFVAFVLALATGWLGGELVDRLGIGVDEGANVNAPSSLTHRRAIRG